MAEIRAIVEQDPCFIVDPEASAKMVEAIDEAKKAGNSIGGVVEVIVEGFQQVSALTYITTVN